MQVYYDYNIIMKIIDLTIAIAYFSIPVQIVIGLCKFPRLTRRATKMKKVVILLILFAFFIFLCGAGHLLRFLDLGETPLFRAVNILTALVSIATSVYLVSFCTVYSCVFIYENHFHSSQYQYLLAVPSYSHKMPFVPNLLEGTDKFYLEATTSKEIIEKMYPPQIRERLLSHEQSRLHGGSGRSNSSPSHDCNETKEIEMKETDSCNKKIDAKAKKVWSDSEFRNSSFVIDTIQMVNWRTVLFTPLKNTQRIIFLIRCQSQMISTILPSCSLTFQASHIGQVNIHRYRCLHFWSRSSMNLIVSQIRWVFTSCQPSETATLLLLEYRTRRKIMQLLSRSLLNVADKRQTNFSLN